MLPRVLKTAAKKSLASLGLQITRINIDPEYDPDDVATYLPFRHTRDAANAAGLSIGDYVDTVMNKAPGSSQSTIDKLASIGVFSGTMNTVVEIGPGTGRYLEKVVAKARPQRYEIYETASQWATYLVAQHSVVLMPTDGYSMAGTPDASVDLVHAHKVFSTAPFMPTVCYWREMARVVRPGGWAVFDIMTERCLDVATVDRWALSGFRNGSYPAPVPRSVAEAYFASNGFALAGSSIVQMNPGTTELLAFHRSSSL